MAEVTIKGAGIIGLSIAWECIQRGAKVQVIDPNGIGAASSGGIVGALAPHVPENWNEKKVFQFESLVMAQSFWDDVDHVSGLNSKTSAQSEGFRIETLSFHSNFLGHGARVHQQYPRLNQPQCHVGQQPCLLYTSPSPRDLSTSRMPSSA